LDLTTIKMSKKKSHKPTTEGSKGKKFEDYTSKEIKEMFENDSELFDKLWDEAELAALNNPDNHGKTI
jgi:hypothetical protein